MTAEILDTTSAGEFYRNRNVLITGATGFLGKALVEKLLRSCEDIGTIYVLIRPKKGNTVEERLHQLLSQEVFNRMHEERPSARNKVVAVAGDLADPQFSLKKWDKTLLENVISVVFHCAATVKFDEELKYAININIGGTKHMIDLAKSMKNLKAFIYVSTAYSNSDRLVIEEKYYPPQAPYHFWQDLILAAQNVDEKELNALTPRLIGNHPNTYTFTKQISESLVYDHKDGIPLVILRPSIVIGAFFEPYPGWVDNINGATGIIIGFYTGFLRMMLATRNNKLDYIGVDFAVNAAIVAVWYRSQLPAGECPVYNCTTGKLSPSIGHSFNIAKKFIKDVPTEKKLWKPRISLTASCFWFELNFIIFSVIPAFVIDFVLMITGTRFSMVQVCRKALKMMRNLSYFTIKSFDIKHENLIALYDEMTIEDKKLFNFKLKDLPRLIEQIIGNLYTGVKKFILKDDMSEQSIRKLKLRVKFYDGLDMAFRVIFFGSVASFIWMLYSTRTLF